MPLLKLVDHAIFDDTDGAGVILDTRAGIYFRLNGTATMMLQAGQTCETVDQTVAHLVRRVDAGPDTLRSGVESLCAELRARKLLASGKEERA